MKSQRVVTKELSMGRGLKKCQTNPIHIILNYKMDEIKLKNVGPHPKILKSPADGTSVSFTFSCKSVVRPLVEDLFINHANGPGRLSRPPAQVPSVGLFNIFGSRP